MTTNARTSIKIDYLISSALWETSLLAHKRIINKAIRFTLAYLKVVTRCGISINLADDALMQQLNFQFLGKDKPTNVLSFPSEELQGKKLGGNNQLQYFYLGDIAISYQKVYNEALSQNKPFRDHLFHLVVHSVLHLCGYDHETAQEAYEMESKEIEILQKFGINNPYILINT